MPLRRPKLRIKSPTIAVAFVGTVIVVLACGQAVSLFRRSCEYDIAADRYREYADVYDPQNPEHLAYSSCYGERWDGYTDRIVADRSAHLGDKAYRKAKADRFRRLSRTYTEAARTPWVSVPDPPMLKIGHESPDGITGIGATDRR